jgi:hypothetical protein
MILLACLLVLLLAGSGLAAWRLRRRGLDRWLVPYALAAPRRRGPRPGEEVHLLLCVADHYEPGEDRAPPDVARARVAHWLREYPRRLGDFRDSDGRPPRHTFFYPLEQYDPACVDLLAELCAAGYGEVEVHLHHDRDTAENLRARLLEFKELLALRHGLLARHPQTGEVVYGFIHGNWCLDNSRRDGRLCGVNNELDVLRETGCYADFTLPSAPHETQTRKVNSLYYAVDDPARPRSHDWGTDVGAGPPPPDSLLLIQGPLVFDWGRRKWGLVPRIENGCLQPSQPPDLGRLPLWLRARVQVPRRPDWFFVKLHAHGARQDSRDVLLGEPMARFHRDLARHAATTPGFLYHYVTARELFNLVKAAEAGWTGSVAGARDWLLRFPASEACQGPVRPPQQGVDTPRSPLVGTP